MRINQDTMDETVRALKGGQEPLEHDVAGNFLVTVGAVFEGILDCGGNG